MSVHIEVILVPHPLPNHPPPQKIKKIILISHRTMNNRFNSISDNIDIIQNISYIVVSV